MSNDLPVIKKDKESAILIEVALKRSVFLQRIVNNAKVLRAIINAMSLEVVSANGLVTESGKLGGKMFVCARGSLNVYTSENVHCGKILPGDLFGEVAFVSCSEEKFNVRAEKRCKLWVLNRSDYLKILDRYFKFGDEDYIAFFKTIPLLRELNDESLRNIREIIRVACYAPNEPIVRQGDEGSQFYIITGGTVMVSVTSSVQGISKAPTEAGEMKSKMLKAWRITDRIGPCSRCLQCLMDEMLMRRKRGHLTWYQSLQSMIVIHVLPLQNLDGREKQVKRLQLGDFFGEGALLGNETRKATVTAEAPGVECIVLDRENFSKFLGDLELIRQAVKKRNENTKEVVEYDMEYHFVELPHLEVLGVISECKFGYIELVKSKWDPDLVFALKTVKKSYVSQYNYIEQVCSEKNILFHCKCPFIVRLYKTFKNKKYLYYLREACLGGDLKYLLGQRKYLDESVTKFIAACVIEAFDYLHQRAIVYQNLKSENLVFDSKGYVKLVGFGNARRIGDSVGAPSSSDPGNLIHFESYDRCNDYRDLGCLIYEMLAGRHPFQDSTDSEDFSNETIKSIKFPRYMSVHVRQVIKKLWKQKPNKGLEYQETEINEIKNTQWFQDFQWTCLEEQTLTAPYIPRIQHLTDLSNFAETRKDKETPPDDCGEWDRDF